MLTENTCIQSEFDRNPKGTKPLTYEVSEIANILGISKRTAYDFCKKTNSFKVIRIGRCVRVHKDSFDRWFVGDSTENLI